MRPRPLLAVLAALLALFVHLTLPPVHTAAGAAPPPGAKAARILWYGVYLGEKRAGYLVRERAGGLRRDGVENVQWSRMHLRLDLRAQGTAVVTDREREVWTTPGGAPLEEYEVTRTAERTRRVRALYRGRTLTYTVDPGDGKIQRGRLDIGPEERFYAADPFLGRPDTPRAEGQAPTERQVRYRDFNPDTLQLEDASLTLAPRSAARGQADVEALAEVVEVGGEAVRAFRQPFKMGGTAGVSYEDAAGEMLRVDIGPIRIVRLPEERAMAPLEEAVEVTEISSCAPDRPIEAPRRLRGATYRIENLTAPLATGDDDVQTAAVRQAGSGRYEAVVTVRTGPPPAPEAGGVLRTAIPRASFADLLRPSQYVPSDRPEVVALAREIVGSEEDAGKAARKLSDYVHSVMTYDPGVSYGVLRDGAQILKSRRGLCQDYATLLVTLCRAASIPAKHCGGLAYVDGRFYPHAWAEVWTGRWVALEPTWGTPFADATHIKLSEGEPTDDRPTASRLDAFRITVLSTVPGADSPEESERD
jgi:Transglutaminase-like enzymes, putative cysteine proteases